MDRTIVRRAGLGLGAAALLAGTFLAGAAYAADARLDQANDAITRAIALVEAAEAPEGRAKIAFDVHRRSAVRNLKQAQKDIERAKSASDRPPRTPPGRR